ncbi:MAG: beta-N-acetylhexosaminidase [Desulfobaccales bacterium]
MKLASLVGERLMIGVAGTELTPAMVRHFQELHAGGLILYRRNFASPGQLKQLITGLEDALGRRLLVAVDHEGGRVIMFREGITVFPDNMAVGATGNLEYARRQGDIEAKELRRLGMDINLAPVLDVLTEAYSPNIGIRSYGRDWRLAAEMGAARISAMQQAGLSACAKHFPGKGHAPVDAHLGLPVIPSTWKEMEAVHLKPFVRAIEAGVDLIMSSHPYYPHLDPYPKKIATFSRKIIHDYLRTELAYGGVIVSDDLEMGAIKEICSVGEAGILAAQAGHDLLLVCHTPKAQKEVYHSLVEAYRNRDLSWAELEQSVERLRKLAAKRPRRFEGPEPGSEPAGVRLAAAISREAVRVLKDKKKLLPLKKGQPHLCVIFPRFSGLEALIMIERELLGERDFVRRHFQRFGLAPGVRVVAIQPSEKEIQQAVKLAQQSEVTIYFCYDAHLYPSNRELLDRLQQAADNLVVVLLRDPYDLDFIGDQSAALTAFGWRACQIKAVIEKMCSPT